ncbi:alpha/beta hydrolase [Labrys monachus]|uniref:Phospholipase/carboxylesterase n=1 Tax=Labrys monachus TaxID=217067 RepID=A0ABU0FHI4_9HYPH|nr:alpha/beta fold hydrolase [Labrys monachus]MDQ0394078.1 phospholipase/carboxylesterase [Labrys monachus]
MTSRLSHIHRFDAGTDKRPLLLLHGTGGDEHDLIDLGRAVAPGAPLLSPRGQVREGAANRFFRRLAEGVFDIADLKARTQALADFTAEARAAYGLEPPVALGFSNGANIAAALLLLRPEALSGAILLRATLPFEPDTLPDLAGKRVLLLSGRADPLTPVATSQRLAALLAQAGADVRHELLQAGHGLVQQDLALARQWWAE